MDPSAIIFFGTFIIVFILHVRNIGPTFRLRQRLVEAVREKGGRITRAEIGLKLMMSKNLDLKMNESESAEIRALKGELIEQFNASMRFHRVLIWVMLSGFALSIVSEIAFQLVKHFLVDK